MSLEAETAIPDICVHLVYFTIVVFHIIILDLPPEGHMHERVFTSRLEIHLLLHNTGGTAMIGKYAEKCLHYFWGMWGPTIVLAACPAV